MAQLSFDLTNIVGQPTRTRADDVRMMFEPYNRTLQQWQMAKNDVSRVPGVNRLAFLQTQQNALLKQSSELATRLRNQQQTQLAALNAARSAAIKAQGRGGGGGNNVKNAIDALKAAGQLRADNPLADFAQALGTLDASLTPVAAAIAQDPDAISSLRAGQQKALTKLQLGEEQAKAISSSRLGYFGGRAAPNELLATAKKIGDATALLSATVELSQGALKADDVEAARSAIADFYGLKAEQVSAESLADVQGKVRQYSENVARDPTERKALQEIGFGLMAGGLGAGGAGGVGARVAIPKIPKLSPAKQAALDKYLAALSDDGIAQVGERVGAAYQADGMIVDDRLTREDIVAGQAAYEEARETGAFTAEQAPLFDRRYVSLLRQQAESAETVARQQEAVLSDFEMGAVDRQREMARRFLDMQNAAEGLRVPLAYEAYGSTFERQVMGEMMDIVRKEGELVYDTGALPTDRERRLGGRGSAARAPHRFAKQLYSMDQSRPGGVRQSDVIPLINKRFRDPRDQERALAYFLAMKEVDSIRSQTGARVEPGQPVQVAQEAQAAMQAVRPTPAPAAGVAGRAVPTTQVQTPVDQRRDPYTADLAGSLLIDPQTGTALTAGLRTPAATTATGPMTPEALRTNVAGLLQQADQFASDGFDANAQALREQAAALSLEYAQQIGAGGNLEGQRIMADYAAGIAPTANVAGVRRGDTTLQQRGNVYLPRDAFMLDNQPFDAQVNAPQAGMNGSMNTGAPRRVR